MADYTFSGSEKQQPGAQEMQNAPRSSETPRGDRVELKWEPFSAQDGPSGKMRQYHGSLLIFPDIMHLDLNNCRIELVRADITEPLSTPRTLHWPEAAVSTERSIVAVVRRSCKKPMKNIPTVVRPARERKELHAEMKKIGESLVLERNE